jgi:hypothetical protein
MKTVKVKKNWHGKVSVKDYELNDAISQGGLIIKHDGYLMEVGIDVIKQKLQGSPDSPLQKSKYNTKPYYLYDFTWKPLIDDKQRRLL